MLRTLTSIACLLSLLPAIPATAAPARKPAPRAAAPAKKPAAAPAAGTVTAANLGASLKALGLATTTQDGYQRLRVEEERFSYLIDLRFSDSGEWLVCMAHHPLFSNGPHGDHAPLIKDWGPLFQKYNVPFYFCGHDHDLQHLEFSGLPTSFIVSGGGGAALTKLKREERGPFSQSVYGFTHLQVSPEKFIVRHIDPQLKQLHGFQRSLNGRVDLLRA